jgi:hypothetical protein
LDFAAVDVFAASAAIVDAFNTQVQIHLPVCADQPE